MLSSRNIVLANFPLSLGYNPALKRCKLGEPHRSCRANSMLKRCDIVPHHNMKFRPRQSHKNAEYAKHYYLNRLPTDLEDVPFARIEQHASACFRQNHQESRSYHRLHPKRCWCHIATWTNKLNIVRLGHRCQRELLI